MKRHERIILYVCLGFIVLYALHYFYLCFPVIRITHKDNEYRQDLRSTYMQSCLERLTKMDDDGVLFVFKGHDKKHSYFGRFEDYAWNTANPEDTYRRWTGDFLLSLGESFRKRPDHHSWVTYKLLSIERSGVVISYESGFSHHSFGKPLVTKRVGKIRLHWMTQESTDNNVLENTGTNAPDSQH